MCNSHVWSEFPLVALKGLFPQLQFWFVGCEIEQHCQVWTCQIWGDTWSCLDPGVCTGCCFFPSCCSDHVQCHCKFCSLCSVIQKTSIFLIPGCGFDLLRLHWQGEMWVFLLFNVCFLCSEFQESSYPDSPVHPHMCAGLRNPAGRDSPGHSLQHKEVNIWAISDCSLVSFGKGTSTDPCTPLWKCLFP